MVARAGWLFSALLSSVAPSESGVVVVKARDGSAPVAVAALCPPGVEFPTTEFLWRGGWSYIPSLTGWERRMRFPGLGALLHAHRVRLMSRFDGHWYVLAAGQSSEDKDGDQPAEILAHTLKHALDSVDTHGRHPVYAETTSARYADAYKRLGFVEIEEARFPIFDVHYRIFVRGPGGDKIPPTSTA